MRPWKARRYNRDREVYDHGLETAELHPSGDAQAHAPRGALRPGGGEAQSRLRDRDGVRDTRAGRRGVRLLHRAELEEPRGHGEGGPDPPIPTTARRLQAVPRRPQIRRSDRVGTGLNPGAAQGHTRGGELGNAGSPVPATRAEADARSTEEE